MAISDIDYVWWQSLADERCLRYRRLATAARAQSRRLLVRGSLSNPQGV